MIEEAPGSLENWMHFWSNTGDFRCFHDDLTAKNWIENEILAVHEFWIDFFVENSNSLVEISEENPSSTLFKEVAQFL
jgi:hypothetical protein